MPRGNPSCTTPRSDCRPCSSSDPRWRRSGSTKGSGARSSGESDGKVEVVEAVPKLGPLVGRHFLLVLGAVEISLAVWVLSGFLPGICVVVQTALLVCLTTLPAWSSRTSPFSCSPGSRQR